MKFLIIRFFKDKYGWIDCDVIGHRNTIQEAEQYREFVIKEDGYNPQNIQVVQVSL